MAHKRSHLMHWAIIYWMPYDNDLHRFKQPILDMIMAGPPCANTVIAVFADTPSQNYIESYTLTNGEVDKRNLNSGDSSDSSILSDCLVGLDRQFKVAKWSLTILGHGGKVDELCPSANEADGKSQWMTIQSLLLHLELCKSWYLGETSGWEMEKHDR